MAYTFKSVPLVGLDVLSGESTGGSESVEGDCQMSAFLTIPYLSHNMLIFKELRFLPNYLSAKASGIITESDGKARQVNQNNVTQIVNTKQLTPLTEKA